MKCLVTGGAGFVGTNLIKRLLKDGHEVVSVDNYTTGKKEYERPGCTYYDFDLSSEHLLGLYVDQTTYPTWRDDDYDFIRGGEGYKKMMMMNSQTTLVFCHRKLISKIKWLQISKVPLFGVY